MKIGGNVMKTGNIIRINILSLFVTCIVFSLTTLGLSRAEQPCQVTLLEIDFASSRNINDWIVIDEGGNYRTFSVAI